MTKDEMKDKISMALKDPILQQGFEIICKNLAQLEKENAELKDWKVIVSICCCSVGGFCCAVASLTQDTTVKIVTAVTALVSLIIGIIFGSLKKKD